jgi:putative endonuclease
MRERMNKTRAYRGKWARIHGLWAEWAAILFLTLKGIRILYHRYKTPLGEIDLIAHDKTTLIFVEVKFRSSGDDLAHVVGVPQQRRLINAAQYFARQCPSHYTVRFDVLLVKPWRFPVHIENAWYGK